LAAATTTNRKNLLRSCKVQARPCPCPILPDIVATKRLQFGSQPGEHNWPGQKHLFGFASFTWQQQAIALLSNPIKDHWRQQQQPTERKQEERE